jgi:hypothetical protein
VHAAAISGAWFFPALANAIVDPNCGYLQIQYGLLDFNHGG